MTMKEASERYSIPVKVLKEYEGWGLKKVMEAGQYDDQDLERLGMVMALYEIGFSSREAETYMRLMLEGDSTQPQRLDMLNRKRGSTLDEIHFKEKQIAHMDYLRYEMCRDRETILK